LPIAVRRHGVERGAFGGRHRSPDSRGISMALTVTRHLFSGVHVRGEDLRPSWRSSATSSKRRLCPKTSLPPVGEALTSIRQTNTILPRAVEALMAPRRRRIRTGYRPKATRMSSSG
jgi:hypothetical protein